MIRSIVVTVLATLVFSVDVSAAMQHQPTGTIPGLKGEKPLPPGPQLILTVPMGLLSLPPEVDQYEVRCNVFVPGYSDPVGHGSAVGAIPNTGSKSGVDFKAEATVGIFFTVGTMETLSAFNGYECWLGLRGTAYGVTTTYLSNYDRRLPYQQGESGFPLNPGAPFIRHIKVQIPR